MPQDSFVITVPSSQPLIGIPFDENGQEVVRYFSDEALTQYASPVTKDVLKLAGAWGDLS